MSDRCENPNLLKIESFCAVELNGLVRLGFWEAWPLLRVAAMLSQALPASLFLVVLKLKCSAVG